MCHGAQVSGVTITIDHLPAVLTTADLAAALGRSVGTVHTQIRSGRIPRPRRGQGRRLLWDRDTIGDWLKGQIAADLRATAIECETLSDSMR